MLQSCFGIQPDESENKEQQKSSSKSFYETELKVLQEHEWIENLYRNNKHKFRVEFPKGWSYGRGLGKNIVARGYHQDSGIVFNLLIKKIDGANIASDEEIKKWDIWETNTVKEKLSLMFADFKEIEIKNVYLDGVHAQLTVYTYTKLAYDQKLKYIAHSIFCYKNGYEIGLTTVLPALFYNEDLDKKTRKYFESFLWEKAY